MVVVMTAETDKDYMRVAMLIDGSIHHTYEFSDDAIQRATNSQVQKNLEARKSMYRNYMAVDHMAATDEPVFSDSAEDYKALDEAMIPYRDLIRNNPEDWDNFLNGHLGAYIDFQNWLKDQYFNKKDEALVRIVDRAIEELES